MPRNYKRRSVFAFHGGKITNGLSRRVLFALGLQGGISNPRALLEWLRPLHPGMNVGGIQTILNRHAGLGLVQKLVGGAYALTDGGKRRIEWLKEEGFSLDKPM